MTSEYWVLMIVLRSLAAYFRSFVWVQPVLARWLTCLAHPLACEYKSPFIRVRGEITGASANPAR